MANLWDIPPKPARGDASPETTFAAVGRALSAWERLDLELAVLYGALLEVPPSDAIKRIEYREKDTFIARLPLIEEAFEIWRITHHDQAIEGAADTLFCVARGLSRRRNDIAHGIVMPVWYEHGADEFFLLPAMYRDKRFNDSGEPDFAYSSVEIDAIREVFERIILWCARIHGLVGRGIDPYPELRL